MAESYDMTPGEIGRSLKRIEEALSRVEEAVGKHDTAIEVLKENRATALWVVNGVWGAILIVGEWFLHGKR